MERGHFINFAVAPFAAGWVADTHLANRGPEGPGARRPLAMPGALDAPPAQSVESFSVRSYGAVGDGATDDTESIQAAIRAAEGGGGTVNFPPGTYIVSTTLTVAAPDVWLAGHGATVRATTGDFDVFRIFGADRFSLDGLQVHGGAADSSTLQFAVMTDGASPSRRGRITRCTFSGASSMIGLNNVLKVEDGCHDWYFAGNHIEGLQGNVSGTGYGVLFGAARRGRVIGNTFVGSPTRGRHAVYLSAGAGFCSVVGNAVVGFDYAHVTVAATPTQARCEQNIITANTCSGGVGVPALEGMVSVFGNCVGTVVANNVIDGSGRHGILVHGSLSGGGRATGTLVTGNSVTGSAGVGIEISGALDTAVVGNAVTHSDRSGASLPHIRLIRDSDTVVEAAGTLVVANTCDGNARAPLQLNSTSPVPARTRLASNSFPRGSVYGIELNGIPCEIDGNLYFRRASGFGTLRDGASATVSIAVAGAALDDVVTARLGTPRAGVLTTAHVSAEGTVSLSATNLSGATVDVSRDEVRIVVQKWPENVRL